MAFKPISWRDLRGIATFAVLWLLPLGLCRGGEPATSKGIDFKAESLPSPAAGRFVVVTVGIDDYQHWPKLDNAVRDVTAAEELLREQYGFTRVCEPLVNQQATKAAIESLVKDRLRRALKPGDSLVLFFAGHGTTRVDRVGSTEIETGFLVPVEAPIGAKERWSQYLQLDPLLMDIGKLPAKHILVILGSCHSGIALGSSAEKHRAGLHYTVDLASRFSRKVITSARGDQLALDGGGPMSGHSLFAGTLMNGLRWGQADLDRNSLITSRELGLFLQQTVGQASDSKQTPDFGAFDFDKRGEMVIAIGRSSSFGAVKARAFGTLQRGELKRAAELASQLAKMRSDAPETLYMQYRVALVERRISDAHTVVKKLLAAAPPPPSHLDLHDADSTAQSWAIPLSVSDLAKCDMQLGYWKDPLSLKPGDFPLEVTLLSGPDGTHIDATEAEVLGDIKAFRLKRGAVKQFLVKNPSKTLYHVYAIEIDPAGLMEVFPLLAREPRFDGLGPRSSGKSNPAQMTGDLGLYEIRLFASPVKIHDFVSPPRLEERGLLIEDYVPYDAHGPRASTAGGRKHVPRRQAKRRQHEPLSWLGIHEFDLADLQMKTIYYEVVAP